MSSYLLVRARWDEITQHSAWSGSVNCDQWHIFLASDWTGPHLWLGGACQIGVCNSPLMLDHAWVVS